MIITLITLVYLIIWVPESPRFMYSWRSFDKSRKTLVYVADKNYFSQRQIDKRYKDMVFDFEYLE